MNPEHTKILIAEDDKDLQDAYSMILKSQGYTVATADNGLEAINILSSYDPDIILLDYLMPKMDGKNFLENLDKNEYPDTKIIVCSNIADQSVIDNMVSLGADGHVLKSNLSPIDLINLVEKYATT